MYKLNDYELIYLVKEDKECLNVLISKYLPLIKSKSNNYLKKYANLLLSYDDLEQECLIAFFYAIKNYKDNKNAMPYTYINICLNGALDKYIRKIKANKSLILTDALSINEEVYENLTFEEFLSTKKDEVENKLTVKELEKELYYYKYDFDFLKSCIYELMFNNFNNLEISELLAITRKKVDNDLYFIRKKLREKLNYY